MPGEKLTILRDLSFGQRVAEDEVDDLASYFVETEQWRKVAKGHVDVIFGAKGAGKSAIYSTLLQREDEFFDEGIALIAAENPRGAPAFKDLVSDPPTTEVEFVSLWKLYIASLIGSFLADFDVVGDASKTVRSVLASEGLLPRKDAPLRSRIRSIVDYVRRALKFEAEVKVDPVTSMPAGGALKITLGEPSSTQVSKGAISVDNLLSTANEALAENEVTVWLLFDRLDVAFAESRDLEANGLRALFKAYLDLAPLDNIQLKVFLRSDIWKSVTDKGFREASHITRQLTIRWQTSSMLNLVVNRILQNEKVIDYYSIDRRSQITAEEQRELFDKMVPEKVDAGKNPLTFEWVLGRAKDGTGYFSPREVIHLLSQGRDAQIEMLERAEEEPPGTALLSRQAFREALYPVSKVRLEQTLYAEYPEVKEYIASLEQEKTDQTLSSVTKIWNVETDKAREIAARLVDIGFFEQRGEKTAPRFWVPFLYRPALNMIQGASGE